MTFHKLNSPTLWTPTLLNVIEAHDGDFLTHLQNIEPTVLPFFIVSVPRAQDDIAIYVLRAYSR